MSHLHQLTTKPEKAEQKQFVHQCKVDPLNMLLCMRDRHVEITFVTKACYRKLFYTTKLLS